MVGTLTGTDPDAGDKLTFTLTDNAGGRFKIGANNQLLVANPALFDGTAGTYEVKVKATDAAGLIREETFTIAVNSKPTGIGLSNLQVRELSASGTLVGTLSAMDPDKGETFTYALVNDAGGRFQIVGNQLQVKNGVALDYEQSGLFKAPTVKVLVTDKGGLTFEQSFMLSVTNWTTEVTPGSGFDDVIIGDRGKDRLGGGAGNDRLEGATANDTLSGGAGHDILKGGQGKDTLAGRAATTGSMAGSARTC